MEENFLRKMNLDTLGIGASLLCAVHCALLPLVLTMLPLLGAALPENEWLEYALLSGSFVIGCLALGRGYFRHHRRIRPLLLFSAGFVLLVCGHFIAPADGWEPLPIAIGALMIIAAHLLNLRGCKQCAVHKGAPVAK
ncbi:MerC domain-containing protein [Chitinophaga nivalis]|uniref:MerC domain-containing protein n=2 Tax=Chitinophaga nivalis TaxID=2991709 RepID=A0ABT3IUP6_9BACT|nr:MerC domain-containing protein [Chitinophaga nivalis]MCW3487673.1 MerC domain-containing protein [Chitinophaga nivalis]